MKKTFGLFTLLVVLNSCAHQALVTDAKPRAGTAMQSGKASGSQSAKPYAPDQQAKSN